MSASFIASLNRLGGVYVLYISAMGAIAIFCIQAGGHLTRKLVGLSNKPVAAVRALSRVEQRAADIAAAVPPKAQAPLVAMTRPVISPAVMAAKMDRVETAPSPSVVAVSETIVASRFAPEQALTDASKLPPDTPQTGGPRIAGYAAVRLDLTIEALTARELCGSADCAKVPTTTRLVGKKDAHRKAKLKLANRTLRPVRVVKSMVSVADNSELISNYNATRTVRLADTPGELVRRSLGGLS